MFVEAYVISTEDVADMTEKAMRLASSDPALIYAARKTGRIVTTENAKRIPDIELDEWDAAVEEYQLHGGPPLTPEERQFEESMSRLREEAERLPYVLGRAITESGVRSRRPLLTERTFARDFLFFAATKSLKTLRAVAALLEENMGEDALSLVRSVYENYLHMLYTLAQPQEAYELARAKNGISAGTHEYPLNSKGRPDRRTIVDRQTGRVVRADISTYQMAAHSPFGEDAEIHSVFYSFLSRYTHPHLLTLPHYLDGEGFDASGRHMLTEAFVFTMCMAALVLDTLLQAKGLQREVRKDVRTFLTHLRRALDAVFESAATALGGDYNPVLRTRVALVGRAWPRRAGV